MILFSVLSLLITLVRANKDCESGNQLYNLTFPANYDSASPYLGENGPINISYRFRLEQITDVNDLEGTLSMLMYVEINWPDRRIVNDTCRGRITDLQYEKIWKPKIKFLNVKDVRVKPSATPHEYNNIYIWQRELSWYWDLQVTIYCNLEFSEYPIDVQRCKFRLLYLDQEYDDVWQRYINDSFKDGFVLEEKRQRELPFRFQYETIPEKDRIQAWQPEKVCGVDDDVWCVSYIGFDIKMTRKMTPFMLNIYTPSTILVVVSWISFWIPTDAIPARMALLVTIYLVLTNIANGIRALAPSGGRATYIDIYLQGCQTFVAMALFEYAFLLFYTRRMKYKRMKKGSIERNSQRPMVIGRLLNELEELPASKKDKEVIKWTDDVASVVFPTLFVIFLIIYATYVRV